ncbi:MAG: Rieske 2Fe-2S domain-containing protein [Actinomycetota bacterium]
MRATSIGHAGILVDTVDGSIVCDPWFLPQFHGSWFVFPRNDQLSAELMHRICNPTYLYVSHIHADHLDEGWLVEHMNKDTTVLVPGYPTRELERILRGLGFHNIVRTVDGQEIALGPDLRIAIHTETSITDGPGGDSAMVISDGTGRLVNQNDCRTNDLAALRNHGPVDLHWLQYSGAIWYPMVYQESPERMRELVDAKVDSQFSRAMRYVESIDARAVVPSAGPPAFLDPELFQLNVIEGDELSIFPDQRSFMAMLEHAGRRGVLAVPGTEIEFGGSGDITVTHPMPQEQVDHIFTHKREYLQHYQADWLPWLQQMKAGWHAPTPDLLQTVKAWFEPLMAMAPTVCAAIDDIVVLHAGDLPIALDFRAREVRQWNGEPHGFWFRVQRELVETVVAQRANDWSNSLFLSCRFSAWRKGQYNEYVYNFLKSLDVERMRRTESEAVRKREPDREGMAAQDIRIGDWMVQRACPHRQADLSVFGEIDGDELVCTLHGWRFDLATGHCRNAADRPLRVRPAPPRT